MLLLVWRHNVIFIPWYILDIMTNFVYIMTYIWRYDVTLTSWRNFKHIPGLTSHVKSGVKLRPGLNQV